MGHGGDGSVAAAIARWTGTRTRRWLVAITLLLGLLAAIGLAVAGSPTDRTFAGIAGPVQLLMSITVPFLGVLLASDLRRRAYPVRPTLVAAVLLGAAVGAYGSLISALALTAAHTDPAVDAWHDAWPIAIGGVLVQAVAHLVGTGMGLLLRPVWLADLATIVIPLGIWLALGLVLPAGRAYTPYAVTQDLLAGRMDLAVWLVMVVIWPVGLNAAGIALLRRRAAATG